MRKLSVISAATIFVILTLGGVAISQPGSEQKKQSIDEKVKKFLASHEGRWRDMNVPKSDGKVLYDLIIKHKYTKALDIGTSTGRSAIWIAWALSKTGGKLITIEIDESRYKTALSNFKRPALPTISMRDSPTLTSSCPNSKALSTLYLATPIRVGTRTT